MQYENNELRRLQLLELDIVLAINVLCERHDIPYFLDSGSALGAVRHAGFIPWDDDIDIGMMRDDYERFLTVARKELPPGYRLLEPGAAKGYAPMFAKVMKEGTKFYTRETIEAGLDQGVFVDVFPYDRLMTDEAAARKQAQKCQMWQRVSYLYHAKTINVPHGGALGGAESAACRVTHYLVRAGLKEETIARKFREGASSGLDEAVRGGGGESGAARYAVLSYPVKSGFAAEDLLPPRLVPFEGHLLPAPQKTEYYLERKYGTTWNQLPPKEQRRNHAPEVLDLG